MGGEGAALALEGLGAHGADPAEGAGELLVGVGVGPDLGELPVGARGALLDRGLRAAGAALGHVLGDGVALVSEQVGEGEGLPAPVGEGDQVLGVLQVGRGGDRRGRSRREDGEPGHGDADDQPAAHADAAARGSGRAGQAVGGPPVGGSPVGCGAVGCGAVRDGAVLPRPLLLHRCSQSCYVCCSCPSARVAEVTAGRRVNAPSPPLYRCAVPPYRLRPSQ